MERTIGYRSSTAIILSDELPSRSTIKLQHNPAPIAMSPEPIPSAEDQVKLYNLEQNSQLVNSSLMFFSTRPCSKSLDILANSPHLESRAMEILLRNWKDGGEFLEYAFAFLDKSTCCDSLLGPNWTCWYGDDVTLFDL